MTQHMNSGLSHPVLGHGTSQRHVPTDFGEHHHHKPTKAIIGVAILVVMGFLTYEFREKAPHPHLSADQTMVQQKMASSAH